MTEPHIPQPSDICSVCGRGLVHVIPSLDATPDPAGLREACGRCGHDAVDHAASNDGSCVAPDCWCAAREDAG